MATATPSRTTEMGPEAAAAANTVPTIKTISEMRWSGESLSPRLAVAGEVTPVNLFLGVLAAPDFMLSRTCRPPGPPPRRPPRPHPAQRAPCMPVPVAGPWHKGLSRQQSPRQTGSLDHV